MLFGAKATIKEIDWKSRDKKAKSIIGLALSNSELHPVNLEKICKEISDELNKLSGAKTTNAKFSLKLQLFKFKMLDEITMCNHTNNLKSLIKQLAEINVVVDKEDVRAILLNGVKQEQN